MRKKIILQRSDVDYVTVLFMILCSGTVFFNIKFNSVFIPMFCMFSILCNIVNGYWRKNRALFICVIVLVLFNGAVHLFDNVAWNGIIQIILYIVGTSFACSSMSFERYKFVYIKVVIILTSIAIFVSFCVTEGLVDHIKININGSFYQMAFLHVVGWGDTVFNTRMCGLFHEPGMFQIILNLGVLFVTDNIVKFGARQKSITQLIFLSLGVLLTRSTSGYIILCVILSVLYFRVKKHLKKAITKIFYYLTIPIVVLVGYGILSSEVVTDKFASTNISYAIRRNDLYAGILMLLKNPILGYGYNSKLYNSVAKGYGMDSMSNGVIGLMLMFGIPVAGTLLFLLVRGTNKIEWSINKKIVFLVLLLEEMTESWFFFPVSLAFMLPFYKKRLSKEVNDE